MQMHASCAARDGAGVLLLGPSGCGKSDMVLRLLDRGFQLVADDRVDIADGWASAPAALAGLLEVRGLGIVRVTPVPRARLALAVDLSANAERLPRPERHVPLGLPLIRLDASVVSAAQRIALALDGALGLINPIVGAFDPRETVA